MILNGKTLKALISQRGYRDLKWLGMGQFGNCYLLKKNDVSYVLKIFNHNDVKRRKDKLLNEGRFLKKLSHPACPAYLETIDQDGILGLVMQKFPGNSLDFLETEDISLSEETFNSIIIQLIDILVYLENQGIRHRDIKLSNLLWDSKKLYLVDFGSARQKSPFKHAFEPDFWALGDVILRLCFSCDEFKSSHKNSFYHLNMEEDKVEFLKRLLYIKKPFNSFEEIKKSCPL